MTIHSNRANTYNILAALIIIAAGAAATLTSCSEIKTDDRFIELPAVDAKRVVLLEEFTGQKCVNCPDAHNVIEGLLVQYPENLISVSIHGGPDDNSIGEEQMPGKGLRNADGAAYTSANNVVSFPAGVINRTSGVQTSDQWAGTIYQEITKTSNVELAMKAKLSDDGQKIDVEVDITPWDNIDGNLQLWVVESGIVSIQRTKTGMVMDYVHNHVLRGAINGHDGEKVKLITREDQHIERSVELRDIWNAENLSIVGFIYTPGGVLQAAKCKVEL